MKVLALLQQKREEPLQKSHYILNNLNFIFDLVHNISPLHNLKRRVYYAFNTITPNSNNIQ